MSRDLKTAVIVLLTSVFVSGMVFAKEEITSGELMKIDWQEMQQQGYLKGNEIVPDEGEHQHPLKIVSPLKEVGNGMPALAPILEFPAPKIQNQVFMLTGWVRYENVRGTGFLEMWSLFPDGSHYFTRTLSGAGPMGLFTGTSEWRPIQLPFQMAPGPDAARPNKLIVNAAFQGPGTIWLSGLKVVESDGRFVSSQGNAWWDRRLSGWIGAIGGTILGLFGSLIGLFSRRESKIRYVKPMAIGFIAIGGVLLIWGLIGVAAFQPWGVYYPLLLLGVIGIVCGTAILFQYRGLAAEFELRRMRAMDLDG